jgi:DNA-binding MarR family transcriptional regulator
MVEDVVRQLGHLTLGTRLKRIGERMQSQTQRILDAHELPIQAAQFPFLAAIDRLGPLTVGELALAVGVTQPGATRTLAQLDESGLVAIAPAADDQRRKSITLTRQGKRLVDIGKREVWPLIDAAVKELCRGLAGTLLDQLAAVEDGLEEESLDRRAGALRARRR